MLRKLKNWLGGRQTVENRPPGAVATGDPPIPVAKSAAARAPDLAEVREQALAASKVVDPGKNAPAQRQFVREATGTYETLKILDASILEDAQDDGADPYNTGGFDRSKSWDKRFDSK